MKKGQKEYRKFYEKQRKEGKNHAEANQAWKEHKTTKSTTKKQSSRSKVSKKTRRKSRKKKEGFNRPASLSEKLRSTKLKSRINMNAIRRVY